MSMYGPDTNLGSGAGSATKKITDPEVLNVIFQIILEYLPALL